MDLKFNVLILVLKLIYASKAILALAFNNYFPIHYLVFVVSFSLPTLEICFTSLQTLVCIGEYFAVHWRTNYVVMGIPFRILSQ
jgi:hypothetical protein